MEPEIEINVKDIKDIKLLNKTEFKVFFHNGSEAICCCDNAMKTVKEINDFRSSEYAGTLRLTSILF